MLGNCATDAQALDGWRLVDRNGRPTALNVKIAPGASVLVPLDGADMQLGNNGGNVVLQGDRGNMVDGVSYGSQDASQPDRFVRFRR